LLAAEPYVVAKLYTYWITINYRRAFGVIDYNGILPHHESLIRGKTFTRKIPRALARIKLGLQDCLFLGNMDAKCDWRRAKDYLEMQRLMLQQAQPEDFVIATGVQYSVRDFFNAAAKGLDMVICWEGEGVNEKGYWTTSEGDKLISAEDPRYFGPTEVKTLLGAPSKAKAKLGCTSKTSFDELVSEMVREDLKSAERDELIKHLGCKAMAYNE
jgi:GDPmannose 4,6-dehydratase